jgi:hypothetical protein
LRVDFEAVGVLGRDRNRRAVPCSSSRKPPQRQRTAQRTMERLPTMTAPRYILRSVFVGDFARVIEMADSNAVT